ncbi:MULTISPECIES: MerR family transcriptional regulator [Priestia]|uniref:MerR family transcriptional regulator n=1 Tax=Priestia TaxID=2800373 RepID=UPI001C8E1015|nr:MULTISPECIES: MerR family transcriptional regulator [Priestia]MBY0214774.1 MerR family transcriptional regulator [Priestia aryabhattai]MDW4511845.1 MerR family transcriptional regulator [Priestia megaterium]
MSQIQEELSYQIKDVAEILGWSQSNVRKYMKYMNLQGSRTEGGHRRFSQQDLNDLLEAKRLKEENDYSLKMIQAHFNKELTNEMIEKNESLKSFLEESVEELQDQVEGNAEKIKSMAELFDGFVKHTEQQIKKLSENTTQEILSLQQLMRTLPDTKKSEQDQQRLREVEAKIRIQAREEAVELWNQKPESERFTRSGFLGLQKTEKLGERQDFIESYIDKKVLKYIQSDESVN